MPAGVPIEGQLPRRYMLTSLFVAALSIQFAVVPLVAVRLGSDPMSTALVIAFAGAACLIGWLPAGMSANLLGGSRVITWSFLCLAVGSLICYVGNDLVSLCLGQAAVGVAFVSFWPAMSAAFAGAAGEGRQAAVQGINTMIQGLSSFAGFGVAAVLVGLVGPRDGLVSVGVIAGLSVLGCIGLLDVAGGPGRGLRRELAESIVSVRRLAGVPTIRIAVLATFPWSLLWWVGAAYLVLFALQGGHSEGFAVGLLALRTAAASVVRLMFGRLARRMGLATGMLGGVLVGALFTTAVAFSSDSGWMAICAIAQGIGLAVAPPASNTLISYSSHRHERPVAYAIPTFMSQLAVLAGPLFFGALAALGGASLALGAGGVIAAVLSTVVVLVAGGMDAVRAADQLGQSYQAQASG